MPSKKTIKKRKTHKTKKNKTKINKKIRGGYTILDMKNPDGAEWKKIEFEDHEKDDIKRLYKLYKEKNEKIESTEIMNQLFPDIPDGVKINAAHEIGQIAWGSEDTPLYNFTPTTYYSTTPKKKNTTTTIEPGTKSTTLLKRVGSAFGI
jgi:hypothetical protein